MGGKMDAKKLQMKCSKCGKPVHVDPEFADAKLFHAECARVFHFSQEECEKMNASKTHMLEQCKK